MRKIKIEYVPHKYQESFHNSKSKFRTLLAGIRGGKTVAGVNESIKIAWNGWKDVFSYPNTGAIVASTYPMLRDVVIPVFFEFCPEEIIKKFNKSEMTLDLINDSKILFRSGDRPDKLRGLKLYWWWIDEGREAKGSLFKILIGRIADTRGCGFVTSTTRGFDWMYEDLFKPWENGNKDFDVIQFRSIDNPYFPKEEAIRLKGMYTDDFYMQELEAKFVLFAGLVYKNFARTIHVIDQIPFVKMKHLIAGVDWGFTNPAVVLFIGIDGEDNYYIMREYYQSEKLIDQIISDNLKIKGWFAEKDLRLGRMYCDPSEPAYIKQFKDSGLNATEANNEIRAGINRVSELLKTRKLFIHSSCVNTIKEFESYSYPEKKEDKQADEIPLKMNDHAMDALRYACMSERKEGSLFVSLS